MVLDDIKALIDMIGKYQSKKQEKEEIINMNKVLTAIYKLGNEGSKSVSLEELQDKAGFSKMEVLNAIERASGNKNQWINDVSTLTTEHQWMLKRKARLYVEGLIEEAEENQE